MFVVKWNDSQPKFFRIGSRATELIFSGFSDILSRYKIETLELSLLLLYSLRILKEKWASCSNFLSCYFLSEPNKNRLNE